MTRGKRRETKLMPTSDDPMGAVLKYVEAFNDGDSVAMAAMCADPMQILDGMSPHVWQGPTAAEDWWTDVLAASTSGLRATALRSASPGTSM